jgi:hypothetical protein
VTRVIGRHIPDGAHYRLLSRSMSVNNHETALALTQELGVYVYSVDGRGFRVMGYSASDPDGVRRLVKRLKP